MSCGLDRVRVGGDVQHPAVDAPELRRHTVKWLMCSEDEGDALNSREQPVGMHDRHDWLTRQLGLLARSQTIVRNPVGEEDRVDVLNEGGGRRGFE